MELRLPFGWSEVYVSLIPKEGKDPLFPQSYRPISLLNVDYKNLMTIMTSRMMKVLVKFIHHDQSGFLKNRYLRDSIRWVLNVIDSYRRG